MVKLGVNVDHVATVRQARGTQYPSVTEAALICEQAGAAGITVHLREDRRHIQDADVFSLREVLNIPLNLEMAIYPEIIAIALKVKPAEVCLVPEKREELTTEGGLDVLGQFALVASTVRRLTDAGIVVSLFIDPDPRQIEAAARAGAPVIELHTGAFCDCRGQAASTELMRLIAGAKQAAAAGLRVNAGHGINLINVRSILRVSNLDTLNIGHSIVARAIFVGMAAATKEMLVELEGNGVAEG